MEWFWLSQPQVGQVLGSYEKTKAKQNNQRQYLSEWTVMIITTCSIQQHLLWLSHFVLEFTAAQSSK